MKLRKATHRETVNEALSAPQVMMVSQTTLELFSCAEDAVIRNLQCLSMVALGIAVTGT